MAYLTREDIPFHYALADAFTLCDAYHCSFIGSTDPNRYYMWTGYTGNDGTGGGPVLGNDEARLRLDDLPRAAGEGRGLLEDLPGHRRRPGRGRLLGLDRRTPTIGNYGDNSLLYFNQYRNAQPGDPLYDKARTGTERQGRRGLLRPCSRPTSRPASCRRSPGSPRPRPSPSTRTGRPTTAPGTSPRSWTRSPPNPEVWSKTALFITYDENDGFFDHVVPPYPPRRAGQGESTVDVGPRALHRRRDGTSPAPYGLGPRVPMLVVSPWSKGGWVCSETFDHTSIIRFMERRFGVHEPNISPWRRAVCGDLTVGVRLRPARTRGRPRCPDTDGYEPPDHDRHPDYVPTPPADPALPRQERGLRPARPLPVRTGRRRLGRRRRPGSSRSTFASGAQAGAQLPRHLRRTAPTARGRTPPRPARRVSDTWNSAYSDGVVRPHRARPERLPARLQGAGQGRAGPEVTARHDGDDVELTFTNKGSGTARLKVTDGYGGRPATVRVRPGATVRHTVDLRASRRWYDLTVTVRRGRGVPAPVRRPRRERAGGRERPGAGVAAGHPVARARVFLGDCGLHVVERVVPRAP